MPMTLLALLSLALGASAEATSLGRSRVVLPKSVTRLRGGLSSKQVLYGAAAYGILQGTLFTLKPEIPVAGTWGEAEADRNVPVNIMTEVAGTLFANYGVAALLLARGADAVGAGGKGRSRSRCGFSSG